MVCIRSLYGKENPLNIPFNSINSNQFSEDYLFFSDDDPSTNQFQYIVHQRRSFIIIIEGIEIGHIVSISKQMRRITVNHAECWELGTERDK